MNRFRKNEHLCSKKQIEALLTQGERFFVFPLKVCYRFQDETAAALPCLSVIAVPKRYFKKAVARNLLKRRMRESFRLHKHDLYTALAARNRSLYVFLQYAHDEALPYAQIEPAMKKILEKLIEYIK